MISKTNLLMGACALLAVASVMIAELAEAETTQTVTEKSSTVNPDGSVSYQTQSVTTKDPNVPAVAVVPGTTAVVVPSSAAVPVVTFYYYSPKTKSIMASGDLTNDVIDIWDANSNHVIDNHEFYTNQMVVYEPVEYSKRTYQDIDQDGIAELTKEEYTLRLQQVPHYKTVNTDSKDGLTMFEFTGVGFQDADNDEDNQISYDELKEAFYHQKGLTPKPEKTNK